MCRLRNELLVTARQRIFGLAVLILASLGAGSALAQPANDYFTNATDLTFLDTGFGSGTNMDDNTGATLEPGEPMILTNVGGASVWYTWTAPTNGVVTFSTSGTTFQTLLAVYTGNNISNLNLIGADNGSHAGNSQVTFIAVAGVTFDITVDGTNGAQGPFTLTWNTTFPKKGPPNDNFTNAIVLNTNGPSGTVFGDNINATLEFNLTNIEPEIIFNNIGGASIWYAWTAPSDGIATFNTAGSTFDTVLGVFLGTNVFQLTEVVANDDFMGRRSSQVSFPVTAGTTYNIDIDGYNIGDPTNVPMGFVELSWNVTPLPANDDFVNATSLGGATSGSISDNNLGATAEPNEPAHAGFPATSSLWYTWTAPQDGDVEVDTMGSSIDTVLAVYNGSTVSGLTQVAANDDLYTTLPFPGIGPRIAQENEYAENFSTNALPSVPIFARPYPGILDTNSPPTLNFSGAFQGSDFIIQQPFSGLPVIGTYGSGASGLHFNAKAGVTYHIAVDGKFGSAGPFQLNWAYHPSGVFRFATEVTDTTAGVPAKGSGRFIITSTGTGNPGMLLYQVSETETDQRLSGSVNANQYDTTIHTGYGYNVPGLLVTITRVGGAYGRVTVGYSTVDGNQLSDHYTFDTNSGTLVSDGVPIPLSGDAPALSATDYTPISGVLTFDDYEMSKTLLIQVRDSVQIAQPNRDFGLVLFNPQIDTTETGDISQPRVDPIFSQALVRILDTDISPQGANAVQVTNSIPTMVTNVVTNTGPPITYTTNTSTTNMLVTNILWTIAPVTNESVFNFSKSYYRVPEDVTNYWKATPITVYVNRSGTNTAGATVFYRVNTGFLQRTEDSADQSDEVFPLQPGSDYAIPNVPNAGRTGGVGGIIGGQRADFDCVASGTITFPGGNNFLQPQPITFTVFNTNLTQFSRDFHIEIFAEDSAHGNAPFQVGMVDEATVTILFPDEYAPAGSVDETYNPDFGLDLVEPVGPVGGTPLNQPGTDQNGQVNAVVVLPNNESIIAGAFSAYNGTSRNGIAMVNTAGLLDTNFDPGEGISIPTGDFISSMVLQPNGQIVVGGSFTSYNGNPVGNIARVNPNGSLDTAFQTASGLGANGLVRSVVINSDGTILIGGDFTSYNNVTRNHVARLNPDGSLDTTFDPGTGLNGPVYSIASSPGLVLLTATNGNGLENDKIFNVGTGRGSVLINYNFIQDSNDLRVFYGGALIFEAAVMAGPDTNTTVDIPFGPGTGPLEIVMNQGNITTGNPLWNYSAVIQSSINPQIIVGGDFTAAGGVFGQDHIARLLTNGIVDLSFDPNSGANGIVRTVAIQDTNGQVLIGGDFTAVNGISANHITRLNTDGSVDSQFFSGTGTDSSVYDINWVTNGIVLGTNAGNPFTFFTNEQAYVGGNFTVYNGTHRLGFARLYPDGSLDTTFLDTAYNQFAGLTRIRFSDPPGIVMSSALETNGNVIIGGAFSQVGGGQFDPNVRPDSFNTFDQWPEPKSRDGVRNRSNVARLIGGSTQGPGNIGLLQTTYGATKSQGTNYVTLIRANGSLGYASANFSVISQSAQSGLDYYYAAAPPLYPIMWEYTGPSRRHSDGLFGTNTLLEDIFGENWSYTINGPPGVLMTILNNGLSSGNLNAQFQLANPIGADQFYLGGENIPVGIALGRSVAPLTIVDDNKKPGDFGFASPTYVGVGSVPISVIRTNGNFNTSPILISYATSPGSNTTSGVDYKDTSGTLSFNNGDTNKSFFVQVIESNYISSVEKSVNLSLFNFPVGVPPALTNAVLRIINPNFQGFLNFSATNYITNLTAGAIQMVVERNVGSLGTLDVQCVTTDGIAKAGTDYVATTTNLHWNSGDVSSRTVSVPLINNGSVGGIKTFGAYLANPGLNGSPTPSLLGTITNTTLTISNDNSYGVFQFSVPSYVVNEATNGTATITVIRTSSALSNATVSFTTADGTAIAGANYIATNGTLSFVQGQTAASFSVHVLDDGVTNVYPFYFNVLLTNVSAGAFLGSPTNAQVNIVDAQSFNRPPGNGDVTFNQEGINGAVLAVALQSNGQIIAGGNFTSVGGLPRNHFVRLNPDGSLDSTYLNELSGASASVSAVAVQSDGLALLGGSFGQIDGIVRNRIARVEVDGSLDTSFNPGSGADNSVFAIAETFISGARKIYVGGAFTTLNADGVPGIGRLNQDGTVDGSFASTGVNGTINAIAVYPTNSIFAGKVLIAGSFTLVNGLNQTNIARLNVDGSLDTNFNASADNVVRALAIQNDDGIVLGGDFLNVDGVPATRLARLNSDGTFDGSFTANMVSGPNGSVQTIALQSDNRILVGGQFTIANGIARNHITRLLSTGAIDPTINFGDGANGVVDTIVVQPVNQMILVGGGFTEYNDASTPYLVRIYGGSDPGSGAFEFTSATYDVNENGIQAVITIRRTGGTSGPNPDGSGNVSVLFSTTPGSAVAGVNYNNVVSNVAFPPAFTLETVTVPVIDDMVVDSNKTVNLILSDPSAESRLGDQTNAVLTIFNTDNSVSFISPSFQVAKNDPTGLANITLTRIGGGTQPCTVTFATTTNGTAVIGTDYFPTNVLVTFSQGVTQQVVQVAITNNNLPEGDRTVDLVLSNAANTELAISNAVLTIKDTTFAPGQLCFASTNFFASEADANAIITVVRSNGTSGTVSAFYYTVPGTAQPGVSYISVSNTITLSDGQSSGTFDVPMQQNSLVLGTVNFGVVLATNLGSGTTLIAPTNATVFIADDNSGFLFANATNTIKETSSPLAVQVFRVGPTNNTLSVNYATQDGTAAAGVNYSNTSGTLTFNPGETSKAILVPIIDDGVAAGTLQFTLALSNPTPGSKLGYPATNYVEVLDADAGISFTNATMAVRRDIGSALVTVITTNPAVEPPILNSNTVPMSVQFTTSDGTALAGLDYIKTSGTLVFTNGIGTNTFRVPIINNSESGTRTFNVSLFNPTSPGRLVAPSNQAISIIDATAGFKFSSSRFSVNKTDGTATINVLRTGLITNTASVDFQATNGTAAPGVQYYPTNGTLVFTNGQTSNTFGVQVIDTSTVQPNETVLLELLNPTNGVMGSPSAATLTIKDNTGSFVVPAGSQIIAESGAGAPNGVVDSNETVTILFAFRDAGGLNVNNLTATLLATNGVTSPSPASQAYGPLISSGHSVSEPFTFTAEGTNGQQIAATFKLQDGTTNIGTGVFGYVLGSSTFRFTNSAAILINDDATATPYPSTIGVSNLVGLVLKATITLTNMEHTSPHDIDALLVSPTEQTVLFMAHCGGQNAISNVTLTFDDAASTVLPQNGQIISGTNQPSAYLPVPVFP